MTAEEAHCHVGTRPGLVKWRAAIKSASPPGTSTVFVNVILQRAPLLWRDDLALDQMRAPGVQGGRELPMKLLRGFRAGRRHAMPVRNLHPVERRIAEIEHRFHAGVQFVLANPLHLEAENGVGVVLEQDDDDVRLFTRHGP